MRKALLVIATASTIAGAVAPASGAAPTATMRLPPPHAGVYSGRTSQGLGFSIRVGTSRRMLTSAHFGFRVRCADHRTLRFTVSPILAGHPWRLNRAGGTGFTHSFRDTTGERYALRGRFDQTGALTGTLSTIWDSPRDGVCRSGSLTWHAALRH